MGCEDPFKYSLLHCQPRYERFNSSLLGCVGAYLRRLFLLISNSTEKLTSPIAPVWSIALFVTCQIQSFKFETELVLNEKKAKGGEKLI